MNDDTDLAQDLAELISMQKQFSDWMQQQAQQRAMLPLRGDIETKLKELLEKARAIAAKYGPASFSISVGFPWGAQISFNWDLKTSPGSA